MRRIAALALCLPLLCGCAARSGEASAPPEEPSAPETGQPAPAGMLPANGGAVAQSVGAVYTLRYTAAGFEPSGLWGSYAPRPGADNQLVRYESGEETVLASGPCFSPLWVLVSIIVGSGLFGFAGMLVGVPTFAVLYTLLREYLNDRLAQKGIDEAGNPVAAAPEPQALAENEKPCAEK